MEKRILPYQSILSYFTDKCWDRFTVDSEGHLYVYGWIQRSDGQRDFLLLSFYSDATIPNDAGYVTSSAKYSAEFADGGEHNPCIKVNP